MKNFLKKCRELFSLLLIKSKVLDLNTCVAHKIKDSEMFFITYKSGDNVIDLWNFTEGNEEEFAATLALYFSEGKAASIIEDSIESNGGVAGDPGILLESYLQMKKELDSIRESMNTDTSTVGNELPLVSPTNMYKPHVMGEKK